MPIPVEGRDGVPTLGREGVLGRVLGVEGLEGVLGRVLGVEGREGVLGRVLGLGRLMEDDGRDDGERLKDEPLEGRLIEGLRLIDAPPRLPPPPPRPPPPGPRAMVSVAANIRMTAMAIRESRVFFMVSPLFLSCLLCGR